MELYDIYYGDCMDFARPLPAKPTKGTVYAVCVNGERVRYVPRKGKWCADKGVEK